MNKFGEREKSFEKKFAHDEELQFKVNARRNKYLGQWASQILSYDSEKEKAKWMAEQSEFINVLPKLNLDDLKRIIQHSSLLIGNDTGPTHMAWGLNVPSITVFGPTPINRVYQTPINKVLKSDSKVDHFNLDKSDYSIKEIAVGDIVKIAQELLKDNL